MHRHWTFGGSAITAFAHLSRNAFLTLLNDTAHLVHAILGVRPPAGTGRARRGVPGSHGPASKQAVGSRFRL